MHLLRQVYWKNFLNGLLCIIQHTFHFHFDEPYDGIVYSSSVALGFATIENILYLIANGLEYALGRALLPVSSHAIFGVIMGYYLGKAKFSVHSKRKWIVLSLLIPFILHGIYDYILISQTNWIYVMLPFMIFLWWLGIRKVKLAHTLSAKYAEIAKNSSFIKKGFFVFIYQNLFAFPYIGNEFYKTIV